MTTNDPKNKKRQTYFARQVGQKILIGDSIVLRISKIKGKRVMVYVEAPGDITIKRPSKEEDQKDLDFDPNKIVDDGVKE